MYQQISANIWRTRILIGVFIAFVIFLGYLFGEAMDLPIIAPAVALIVAIIMSFSSYYFSDQIVMSMSRARPVEKHEYPYLYNTVEGLSLAAGIPTPKMFIIEDSAPNAFATGRDPAHAAVAVTTGLLEKLDRLELEGVLAHEISHIKNYDIRLSTIVVVLVGVVALLADWLLRSFRFRGRRREREGGSEALFLLIGLVMAILAPLAAQLIQLAISRQREYLADASGAMLTRYPEGLASALEKISSDREPLEAANRATAHLYIVNPLKGEGLRGLFSTHPPVEERIRRLRSM